MKLMMVGVNHELLNLDKRKDFYFKESDKYDFATRLLDDDIDQTVILSTCNRSEVYVVVDASYDANRLVKRYLSFFHQDHVDIMVKENQDAISYLLEVSCGLKSMVIGEDQILHQIKEAYTWALQHHFTGKEMNYIFHQVLSFSKKMKAEYAISNHPLSLSYIGYQHIQNELQDDDKVMICGSGEMARLMVEYLSGHDMYLVNRTYKHVEDILDDHIHYVEFENRYDYLDDVKLVVGATGSPHVIFKKEYVNVTHPLIFLDLAMPRDIDQTLNEQHQVIDMDVLQQASDKQLQKRQEIASVIQKQCQEFVLEIVEGLQSMKSDDIIQRMQERYLNISDETYELLSRKIDLNPKQQYLMKKILKTSFLRLLKDPIRVLKQGDVEETKQYIEMIEKMISGENDK